MVTHCEFWGRPYLVLAQYNNQTQRIFFDKFPENYQFFDISIWHVLKGDLKVEPCIYFRTFNSDVRAFDIEFLRASMSSSLLDSSLNENRSRSDFAAWAKLHQCWRSRTNESKREHRVPKYTSAVSYIEGFEFSWGMIDVKCKWQSPCLPWCTSLGICQ